MKKILTLCLYLALFLPAFVFGQSGKLSGQITDGVRPVPFAHLKLLQAEEKTAVSDEKGYFTFNKVNAGNSMLEITAVGFTTTKKPVNILPGKTQDLGKVALKEDMLGLDEVVVTGTMQETYVRASPVKVEVVPMRFIQKNIAPTNLIETISLVNGLEEVVGCGVCYTNNISINGLPGPYTAVLIDGSPVYGNLAAVYGLNGIPTQIVERIEVIKGPVSTLYGSEAVAGVINVITKDPATQPFFSADIMATTHKETFTNLAFSPKFSKAKGYIGLHHAYINHLEDRNKDGFNDMPALDRFSLFSKWHIERKSKKAWDIGAKFYYEDRRNGVEAFLKNRSYRQLRGSDKIYGESIYTHRGELFGNYAFNTNLPLELSYSASFHKQNSYYGSDFYEATQQIGFLNLLSPLQKNKHHLLLGTTLRYQMYDDNTTATENENNTQQYIYGIFAQDEWKVSPKLSLLGGARLDYYKSHGLIFAPRANVKYQPSGTTSFRANFGTGFRVVNLFTEDHAFVSGQRKVEITEALEPEKSYNLSFNYNQFYTIGNTQGVFDLDLFYTHFTNKIIPDYDTPGKIIYANSQGKAVSKGISAKISHQFGFPLSFTLAAGRQFATQTEPNEEGEQETTDIEFAPEWSAVFTANYALKKYGLDFALTTRATGPQKLPEVFDFDKNGKQTDKPRPTRSEPYVIQSMQVTKTFGSGFSLYAGVENLFDFRQDFSPLSGYNDPKAAPGFSPHFDTAYAYAVGHSREYYLGLRWQIK